MSDNMSGWKGGLWVARTRHSVLRMQALVVPEGQCAQAVGRSEASRARFHAYRSTASRAVLYLVPKVIVLVP